MNGDLIEFHPSYSPANLLNIQGIQKASNTAPTTFKQFIVDHRRLESGRRCLHRCERRWWGVPRVGTRKAITPSLPGPFLLKATHPPPDLLPLFLPLHSTSSHYQSLPSILTPVPSRSTLFDYLSILLPRGVLIWLTPHVEARRRRHQACHRRSHQRPS